ncbi:unnamed protein product [Closterium sp. NIES-64]|nr:unnamed protein product [Closterium sp. NIES-64]
MAEPGFIDRHTLLAGATQGALNKKVRRMLKVMDAVRQLRASDGDANTEAVVDTLHRIAASGIGTFADALTVLKPGTAPMLSKEPGLGVKGLGPKVVSKLRLACALVALNLKQSDWVETLFPDTWEEQMPKTKADLAKPTAPAKSTAPAKPTAPFVTTHCKALANLLGPAVLNVVDRSSSALASPAPATIAATFPPPTAPSTDAPVSKKHQMAHADGANAWAPISVFSSAL